MNTTTATPTRCDRCGTDEGPLESVGRHWDYCPTCKADWRGYEEGRRHAALDGFDRAITAVLGEDYTHDQLRKALDLRLREGEHALECGADEVGGLD